jgi:multidrug efflux pump subunit AcrA (membrane-fusion protein)
MHKASKLLAAILVLVGVFLAGYWLRSPGTSEPSAHGARRILYYHDPMHPSYKSDKPGIAPDCGMQLEPVYEEGGPAGFSAAGPLSPGAVKIDVAKQQALGLRTVVVARSAGRYTLRALGKVAADETRLYRLSAYVAGYARSVSPHTSGSIVNKDELLASFIVREVASQQQSFFIALKLLDDAIKSKASEDVISQLTIRAAQARETLRSFGVSEGQIRELTRTREVTAEIEFRSPVTGLLLARNIGLGQRVDQGAEVYRIADLSRVWVLADLFENESALIKPGSEARIRYQGHTFRAQVPATIPQFDPARRTLRFRLELDNHELLLRPDMFVDVELDVPVPSGIAVPVDAVLDSGRHKMVYVSREDGVFEPREVIYELASTQYRYELRTTSDASLAAQPRIENWVAEHPPGTVLAVSVHPHDPKEIAVKSELPIHQYNSANEALLTATASGAPGLLLTAIGRLLANLRR